MKFLANLFSVGAKLLDRKLTVQEIHDFADEVMDANREPGLEFSVQVSPDNDGVELVNDVSAFVEERIADGKINSKDIHDFINLFASKYEQKRGKPLEIKL